jgi:hypothetical protein
MVSIYVSILLEIFLILFCDWWVILWVNISLKDFFPLNFQGGVDEKVKNGQEVCTLDGTLDWHGRPAIRQRTGSWVAATLILGNYFLHLFIVFIFDPHLQLTFYFK